MHRKGLVEKWFCLHWGTVLPLVWKIFGGSEQRPPYRMGKLVGVSDFRLPPRSSREVRSSGLLRSMCWQFIPVVLGQRTGPILKGQESIISWIIFPLKPNIFLLFFSLYSHSFSLRLYIFFLFQHCRLRQHQHRHNHSLWSSSFSLLSFFFFFYFLRTG